MSSLSKATSTRASAAKSSATSGKSSSSSSGRTAQSRGSSSFSSSSSSSGGKATQTNITMPDGRVVQGQIVGGKTYVNGAPVAGNPMYEGAQVATGGGTYTIMGGKGVLNGSVGPTVMPTTFYGGIPGTPQLMSGDRLEVLYGLMTSPEALEAKMKKAVEDQYVLLDTEAARNEDRYYDTVAASTDSLLGALRKSKTDAIATGASKGMDAANELSALLGTGQQNAEGATLMAQARTDLSKQKAADLSKVSVDAVDKANALNTEIARIAASLYNAGQIGYGSELANQATIISSKEQAAVQRYAADVAAASQAKYAAGGGSYGGGSSGTAGIENTDYGRALMLLQSLGGDSSKLPAWALNALGISLPKNTPGGGSFIDKLFSSTPATTTTKPPTYDYTNIAAQKAGTANGTLPQWVLNIFKSPGSGSFWKPN